jgi:hypothetical protein
LTSRLTSTLQTIIRKSAKTQIIHHWISNLTHKYRLPVFSVHFPSYITIIHNFWHQCGSYHHLLSLFVFLVPTATCSSFAFQTHVYQVFINKIPVLIMIHYDLKQLIYWWIMQPFGTKRQP